MYCLFNLRLKTQKHFNPAIESECRLCVCVYDFLLWSFDYIFGFLYLPTSDGQFQHNE